MHSALRLFYIDTLKCVIFFFSELWARIYFSNIPWKFDGKIHNGLDTPSLSLPYLFFCHPNNSWNNGFSWNLE